jgi:hypothetical protein
MKELKSIHFYEPPILTDKRRFGGFFLPKRRETWGVGGALVGFECINLVYP